MVLCSPLRDVALWLPHFGCYLFLCQLAFIDEKDHRINVNRSNADSKCVLRQRVARKQHSQREA